MHCKVLFSVLFILVVLFGCNAKTEEPTKPTEQAMQTEAKEKLEAKLHPSKQKPIWI